MRLPRVAVSATAALIAVVPSWSAPVRLPESQAPIGYVELFESSPPSLTWYRYATLVWAPMNELPLRTVGSAPSFFAPYADGRAYRAQWSPDVGIDEVQGLGWWRVARLAWEPDQLAVASSGTGRLVVAAGGGGSHRGLWLYSGMPARPLARRVRLTGDRVIALSLDVTWRDRGVAAWATASALYARRIREGRPGPVIRLARDRGGGRGLAAASADDGSLFVSWLDGRAGRPGRVRLATLAGASRRVRTFIVGAPLRPLKSPVPAVGRKGDGLLLWAGWSGDGVAHAVAAPVAHGRPYSPVELARQAEAVAIGDASTSPDGSVEAGSWLQWSGAPEDGVYALFARDGRLLAPERVSNEPPARPLTTSLAFDPCTARAYIAWAGLGSVALASREPLTAAPTSC
jgi:hypothetical protein